MSGRWVNRLPKWIVEHDEYHKLKAGLRHTLQSICNWASKPDAEGNLLDALVGGQRIGQIGISRATFFRHVARLEAMGFLVVVNRGGGHDANVWAIPGAFGSLDAVRAERRVTSRGRGGARPSKYRFGQTAKRLAANVVTSQNLTPGVSQCDASIREMRRQPSQNEPLPSPLPSPTTIPTPSETVTGGKVGPWTDENPRFTCWLRAYGVRENQIAQGIFKYTLAQQRQFMHEFDQAVKAGGIHKPPGLLSTLLRDGKMPHTTSAAEPSPEPNISAEEMAALYATDDDTFFMQG